MDHVVVLCCLETRTAGCQNENVPVLLYVRFDCFSGFIMVLDVYFENGYRRTIIHKSRALVGTITAVFGLSLDSSWRP